MDSLSGVSGCFYPGDSREKGARSSSHTGPVVKRLCLEGTPESTGQLPGPGTPGAPAAAGTQAGNPGDTPAGHIAFDALWLDAAAPLQGLLDQQGASGDDVVLVQRPEDLAQDSLTLRIHLDDQGQVHREPGRLFCHDRPLCLVLDCRQLPGERLAAWNDLLDANGPCLHDRCTGTQRALGDHVRLLVLLSQEQCQLNATGPDTGPGMDFWRRVNRPGLTWEAPDLPQPPARLPPLQGTLAPAATTDEPVVIDFALQGDWRRTLYGATGVDEQGLVRHCPGALEKLAGQPAGTRVILRGADWSELLCHEWHKIETSGLFESNGRQQSLPPGLVFCRSERDEATRQQLGRCIVRRHSPSPGALVINQHNLEQWLAQGSISADGRWQHSDVLLERLAAGADLVISSPLGESGWWRLLGRLREAGRGEGGIAVFVAHEEPGDESCVPQLAPAIGPVPPVTDEEDLAAVLAPGVRIRSWQDSDQITDWQVSQQETGSVQTPQLFRVHPGTRLGCLFDQLHVVSDQRPLFGREQTALEQALETGQPVVLQGLETQPQLQWKLESLLCDPPSLLINGRLRSFPRADLTLLWQDLRSSPSPVWSQALLAAEPLPPADPWESLRRRGLLDARQIESLRPLVDRFFTAWRSVPAALAAKAGSPPPLTTWLLEQLVTTARNLAHQEGQTSLAAHHWRRALDSVLAHRSRACPPVRDFLKVVSTRLLPDPGAQRWVDPDRLARLLEQESPQRLDTTFLQERRWSLMRALGPDLLPDLSWRFDAGATAADMKWQLAMIRVWGPDGYRQLPVAEELAPDEALLREVRALPAHSGDRLKRLRDALTAGWRWRDSSGQDNSRPSLYPALVSLAAMACSLERLKGDKAHGLLQEPLLSVLEWTGQPELQTAATQALVRDLLHGRMDQGDRERRRLARLRQRLEQAPLVIIEGPTATGKSHLAARVAREAGIAFVVSLGPDTTEDDLLQSWVWQQHGHERTMVRCDKVIMEWLRTPAGAPDQWVTLVIDEANLASPGVLDCLKGLWERPPCIYIRGEAIPVSPRHRVIFTGNPPHYAGRHADPDFAHKALCVHYPPLDDDFLRQQVIQPALERHLARHVSPALLQELAGRLLHLWRASEQLLQDRLFTPRDLVDLCAWLGWHGLHALEQGLALTPAGLNALLLQALRDLLEAECDDEARLALRAQALWFAARWPVDSSLPGRCGLARSALLDEQFLLHSWRVAPYFDSALPAVMSLASAVNRDLDRCDQAMQGRLGPGRRQATLIEGPSGRGKDVALRLLLDSWQQQRLREGREALTIRSLCAADCPWDRLCAAFHKARTAGELLVISELNLLQSQALEGELNAALAGEAAPGFHLLATINPPAPGFRGRCPLSPALLGRFRRILVPDYSAGELRSIAALALNGSARASLLCDQLTHWHQRLCQLLQSRGLAMQPVSQQLVQLARACSQSPATDPGALFDSHYRMYLAAAQTDRAALDAMTAPTDSLAKTPDSALTEWVNSCQWLSRPLTVWRGTETRLDWQRRLMVLPVDMEESPARRTLRRKLLRARWKQDTGLAIKPPATAGLEALLYRLWQQLWCQHLLVGRPDQAREVFPLSAAGQQTLAQEANRPWVQGLEALCQTWPDHPWQWQRQWQRIRALCRQRATPAGPGSQPGDRPAGMPLDSITDGATRPPVSVVPLGTFGQEHDDSLYRLGIMDVILIDGALSLLPCPAGRMGFEQIEAEPLRADRPPCLAPRQYYGIHPLPDQPGWQALPGLDPADRLVMLRTEPPRHCVLRRDCDTGLHAVLFTDAHCDKGPPVQVHYVLEVPAATGALDSHLEAGHPDSHCDPVLQQRLDNLLALRHSFAPATAAALEAVVTAPSAARRLAAIFDYCCQFRCDRAPADGEDLLSFLVREQQGSCRHRACVHVLLCRRFGIAARLVAGHKHLFVEHSLDGGSHWQRHNLGGEPVSVQPAAPAPCQVYQRGEALESAGVLRFVRGLDAPGQELLAGLMGVDRQEIEQLAQTGVTRSMQMLCLLQEDILLHALLSIWGTRYFVLSSCLIRELEQPAASIWHEVGRSCASDSSLSVAAFILCLQSAEDQILVREQLVLLVDWSRKQQGFACMRGMLANLFKRLAWNRAGMPQETQRTEAMLQWLLQHDWLLPDPGFYTQADHLVRSVLQGLASRDSPCRGPAQRQLACWYRRWLSRPWTDSPVEELRASSAAAWLLRHWQPSAYGGRLQSLEAQLSGKATGVVWTDQPEGVPDTGRLLNQLPAFRASSCVMTQSRTLLVMGVPNWMASDLNWHASRLLHQWYPGLGHNPVLQDNCQNFLRWGFCCCLYETACQGSGGLRVQTAWTCQQDGRCFASGLRPITSPLQLVRTFGILPSGWSYQPFLINQPQFLCHAGGVADGLVLDTDALRLLVDEYLASLDPDSLLQALGQLLRQHRPSFAALARV